MYDYQYRQDVHKCLVELFGEPTDFCLGSGWMNDDGGFYPMSSQAFGIRDRDHREAGYCLNDVDRPMVLSVMKDLGFIRIHPSLGSFHDNTPSLSIELDIKQEPTYDQWKALKQCAKDLSDFKDKRTPTIWLDISDEMEDLYWGELQNDLAFEPKERVKLSETIFDTVQQFMETHEHPIDDRELQKEINFTLFGDTE